MATPVLIIDDTVERGRYQGGWNAVKTRLQAIVALYDATGLSALTPSQFPLLFNDTPSLIYDKITGGSLVVGSVTLDKAKAIDIVQKPTGYNVLLTAIEALRADLQKDKFSVDGRTVIRLEFSNISQYFILDGANTVQFATALNTQIANYGKVYASSDKAVAMYNFAQFAVAKYFELGLHLYFGHQKAQAISEIAAATIESIDNQAQTFKSPKHLANQ